MVCEHLKGVTGGGMCPECTRKALFTTDRTFTYLQEQLSAAIRERDEARSDRDEQVAAERVARQQMADHWLEERRLHTETKDRLGEAEAALREDADCSNCEHGQYWVAGDDGIAIPSRCDKCEDTGLLYYARDYFAKYPKESTR